MSNDSAKKPGSGMQQQPGNIKVDKQATAPGADKSKFPNQAPRPAGTGTGAPGNK